MAGCEADPVAQIPKAEGALPTIYGPQRVTVSSFSEVVSCSDVPQKELESCKQALAEAQARIAVVEKERDRMAAALAEAQARIAALLNERGQMVTAAAATQAGLEDSRRRLADLEREIAGLRESQSRLEGELASAKAAAAELQQIGRQERRKVEDLQLQATESEQELTRRKAALADTTRHLAGLEQDRQKIALALAEAQGQVQQLSDSLAKEQANSASLLDENTKLSRSLENLKTSLEAEIAKRDVLIRESRGQLVITLLDRLLFDSGQTAIKPTALKSLHEVSALLKSAGDKDIRIEGHTDSKPIQGSLRQRFPSNWELSAARATSVVHYLVDTEGIPATRVSVVGYADTKPVAGNETEEGRSQNRRIEILLYPKGLVRPPGPEPQ
jgi:chemotaxis protein MotB